ncbi:MAG: ATP-dependent DNA helicase [Actinomycetaceae bacterium]|nr:ATP-dependent DNA helicase [Actinomycetaceae bacterium]
MSSYESIMRSISPAFLPTPEQRAVIESASSSILVVAGAGSGKTATMANRIAYQVARENVRPGEVLGLTFTRKAAGELAQRVERSLAAIRRGGFLEEDVRSSLARPHISTYNAFASQIAQTHGMLVGADSAARLITDAERRQLMSEALATTSVSEVLLDSYTAGSIVGFCLALAAGLIDNDVSLEEMGEFVAREHAAYVRLNGDRRTFRGLAEVGKEWSELKKKERLFAVREACLPVVESYFALKRSRGLIEFADQVALATKVLRAYPQVGREISSEYRLVLLDEYQDTSSGQAEFLRLALGARDEGRSVCAVGDPNQAIYGWRGASANALADFAVQFGPGTERLSLSTSFRSDHAILSAANAVAGGLVTEGVEVKELDARQGAGPGRITLAKPVLREDSYRAIAHRSRDVFRQVYAEAEPGTSATRAPEVAVLCRKRSYFEPMIQALRELDIPYEIVGGESLVLRPEIVTVRSALGVVASPSRNDLLMRLLAVWALGVNDLRALHAWARELAAGRERVRPKPESRESAHADVGREGEALGREGEARAVSGELAGLGGAESRGLEEPRQPGHEAGPANEARHGNDEGRRPREEVSLIEAVTELPDESWAAPSGLTLSEEGRRRLVTISSILAQLRRATHLPLGELVSFAVGQLGLDVAAATRTEGSQRVKTSLDSFIALGREFQDQHPGQGLAEFLAWLDLVETHEHGGEEEAGRDEVEAEVHPGIVQIMTVHAAKGLEWRDLVAIPEMVESEFGQEPSSIKTWLTSADIFPEPLRKDARHLPVFRLSDHDDKIEAGQEYYRYRREVVPEYRAQEARRLAYVAFTRPSAELLLASYGLDGAKEITAGEDGAVKLCEPSSFLRDVEAMAVPIAEVAGEDWPEQLVRQCPERLTVKEAEEAIQAGGSGQQAAMLWPGDVERRLPVRLPGGSVSAHGGDGHGVAGGARPATTDGGSEFPGGNAALGAGPVAAGEGVGEPSSGAGAPASGGWEAELFVLEREDRLTDTTVSRPYVTATDVVHMADDREAYLRDIRRPIPQRPSRSARTGTDLHARIAGFYERPATLDLDAVLAADQQPVDQDLMTRAEERRLFEAFESSRWVRFPPVAIEESLTVVIGGKIVRCKIDAVLDTSAAPDLPDVTIVDWKTGRRPGADHIASRQLQLAIYRLAWARTHDVPVESIGSCFVYLRDGSVLMVEDMSEEDIAARMTLE